MSNLSKQTCKPCEGIGDRLSPENIQANLKQVTGWSLLNNHHIEKSFKFKDFSNALTFVNKVAKIAEKENHHPNISFTWGEVIIKLWTHSIHGLSMNDFILAAKIDKLKINKK